MSSELPKTDTQESDTSKESKHQVIFLTEEEANVPSTVSETMML